MFTMEQSEEDVVQTNADGAAITPCSKGQV